jgi:hypothetical protein
MLGTIFGDLAACTFKQNRLLFNTDLVGEDTFLSGKGLLAMATAVTRIGYTFQNGLRNGASLKVRILITGTP